jgi:hypothetical protein
MAIITRQCNSRDDIMIKCICIENKRNYTSVWSPCIIGNEDISPGRTCTVVNDRLRRNTPIYMMLYYDRISP